MNDLVRSFVAVETSEGARAQLSRLIAGLRPQAGPSLRWVKPEIAHLTLAFLGEVSAEFLESARSNLAREVPRNPVFDCRLAGLGAFPNPGRARVVWVGMTAGHDELCRLQQRVVAALVPAGFEPERRPYSPHLTLARLREPADVRQVVAHGFEGEPFTVRRVVLFRSVLGPGGPTYTALAEFPLAAAQRA